MTSSNHKCSAVWTALSTTIRLLTLLILATGLLANTVQAETSSKRTITAAVLADFPPLYSLDENGQPVGFAIDILEDISRKAELTVNYLITENWSEALAAVRSGNADLIPGIGINDERQQEFLFSEEVETVPVSCFIRTSTQSITGIDSLPGHRVAVIRDSAAASRLQEIMPTLPLMQHDNINAALLHLMAGDDDAFIFPEPVLKKKMLELGIDSSIIKVVGKPLMELKRGFLLQQNGHELLGLINPIISAYTQSPLYLSRYQRWYGKPLPFWTPKRIVVGMALLFLVMLAGLGLRRNYTLKKLNLRLQNSEAELSSIYENAPLLMMLVDRDRRVVKLNAQAAGMAEQTDESYIGHRGGEVLHCVHADDSPKGCGFANACEDCGVRNAVLETLKTGKPIFRREAVFSSSHAEDHSIMNLLVSTTLVTVQKEERVLICLENVTEQHKQQAALRESENRWHFALEGSGAGVWDYDIAAETIFFSQQWKRMFGYSNDGLSDRLEEWYERIHPNDREKALAEIEKHLRGETSFYRNEQRLLCHDGSYKWVLALGKVISHSSENKPLRFIGTHTDITSLKETELLLHDTQKIAKLGSWTWDTRSNKVTWSDELYRITHREKQRFTVSYENYLALIHPDDKKQFTAMSAQAIEKKQPYHFEYRLLLPETNQEKFIIERGMVILGKNGEAIKLIGTVQDITEQKQAELTRQKIEKQLRQAQKMEAIGTLAGGIAHDFNNILSAILGYAEIALDETERGSLLEGDIKEIIQAGNRASSLVNQILACSRQLEQQFVPLQIQHIIKEAIKMLRASLPSTIQIHEQIETSCPPMLADPTQILQIILNLCTNAKQAMAKTGGELTIALHEQLLPHPDYLLPDEVKGPHLLLMVQDNGTGMDQETMEKIFDPFFTTKGVGEGTGLGLAVVHGIVKSHHGYLLVDSTPGVGTSFRIFFPLAKDTDTDSATAIQQTRTSIPGGKEHIMVVDDEPSVVEFINRKLSKNGYQVKSFTNSVEALIHFQENVDKYDLLISDVTMPEINGMELASRIFAQCPTFPIILMTGFSELTSTEQAKAAGIQSLLMKPIVGNDLLLLIREVFDNG